MSGFLWNLGAFVLVLGVLITFHELGHYWVAKRCGVKVLRFSVGFGKPIWKRTNSSGTEFVIAAIPLGGYVRMLDERVDDVSDAERDVAFNNKPVSNRIAILAAGPLANFILAIFAFWLMFLIGVPTVKPVVGDVLPNSIASQSALPVNHIITQIGSRKTQTWEDVSYAFVEQIGEDSVEVVSMNTDDNAVATTQLDISEWHFDPDKQGLLTSLGITPYRPEIKPTVAAVSEDSPAKAAGIEVGDIIKAIDGSHYESWQAFVKDVAERPNQYVEMTLERNNVLVEIGLTIGEIENKDGSKRGFVGVSPTVEPWPESLKIHLQYDPLTAIPRALDKTWHLVELTFDMIGKLITGTVSVKNLSGPISIAQGAGNSADFGLVYLLGFMALISVNLGVINLLPLPVLDGGHLLYYVIELLRGKPLPERVQEIGFRIGAALLFMLMGVAILNDISRL